MAALWILAKNTFCQSAKATEYEQRLGWRITLNWCLLDNVLALSK